MFLTLLRTSISISFIFIMHSIESAGMLHNIIIMIIKIDPSASGCDICFLKVSLSVLG